MKKGIRAITLYPVMAATLFCQAARSQDSLIERKLANFIESADALAARPGDEDALIRLRAANSTFLDVIGKAEHRKAYKTLGALFKKHEAGSFSVPNKDADKLLDQVGALRRQVSPEELIPLELILQLDRPRDARLLYTLAEAFGTSSQSADAKRASRYLQQVLAQIREDDEQSSYTSGPLADLIAFLPELGAASKALDEDREDTVARLRLHLARCADRLEQGLAIDPWSLGQAGLAQEQLILIWERLVNARQRLEQARCKMLLDAMLRIQPHNPVMHFAMAEVQMSFGPAFDQSGAQDSLKTFLRLTEPSQLRNSRDRRFRSASEEDVLGDLRRFRLAVPRTGLEAQRVAADEYLEQLKTHIKKKDNGLLLAPDGTDIRKQVRKLESSMKSKRKYRDRQLRMTEKYRTSRNRQDRLKYPKNKKLADRYVEQYDELAQRRAALEAVLKR